MAAISVPNKRYIIVLLKKKNISLSLYMYFLFVNFSERDDVELEGVYNYI